MAIPTQSERRVRKVSVMLVERTITHPILPSGLAVISGTVIHMKSYFSKAKKFTVAPFEDYLLPYCM